MSSQNLGLYFELANISLHQQQTSSATAVDVTQTQSVFKVVTQTFTTAANGSNSFNINIPTVKDGDMAFVTLMSYSGVIGTNGSPIPTIYAVGNGLIRVNICNVDATNALNGTLTLGFRIIQARA